MQLGRTSGPLVAELRLLRRRRDELECRMMSLQSSRRHLISQLDSLMNLLKASIGLSVAIGVQSIGNH